MGDLSGFLERYGEVVLFVSVFAQQIGIPLPAIPVVLGAGALAGAGKMSVTLAFVLSIVASLPGDLLWYEMGRRRGRKVLSTLCRISLEPDSCVRRTESFFDRHGVASLVVARFIPGLSTVATPLAGIFHVGRWRFLAYDLLGAVLWTAAFLGIGYAASDQLERVAGNIQQFGGLVAGLVVGAVVAYFVVKMIQRYWLIRTLRVGRIDADELKRMLDEGHEITIVDMRSARDLEDDPYLLPGAVRVDAAAVAEAVAGVPRHHEIVLYCT